MKYTTGIKDIISFNNIFPALDANEIYKLKELEQSSNEYPILEKIFIGQEASIIKGLLRKSIVTIASMPKEKKSQNIYKSSWKQKEPICPP